MYEKIEQIKKWFEEIEEENTISFDEYEDKLHPNKQVSAIMFMASKLKNKENKYWLQGAHDVLYLGSPDMYEDFTKDEIRILKMYNIYFYPGVELFEMYAST